MNSPLATTWFPENGAGVGAILANSERRQRPSDVALLLRDTEAAEVKATTKILKLDPGLYCLGVAAADEAVLEPSGIALPATHITAPPSDRFGTAEIVAASGDSASWIGPEGGIVVIKAPLAGGHVLIATYEAFDRLGLAPKLQIRRLDGDAFDRSIEAIDEPAAAPLTREVRTEILLHIELIGDRRMPAQGWVGNRGEKLRIEAFGIWPLEGLEADDVEYKAFGPDGRETPWVSGGKLCGTRGRNLPLTGFAIRLAPQLRNRFEIEYQGAFFESGISEPSRDGEPCMARIANDPLEAINLRLTERLG